MNLTIESLRLTYDRLRLVLYANPSDKGHPLLDRIIAAGFEVEWRPLMVVGKAFYRSPQRCGIVDLRTGDIFEGDNKLEMEPSIRIEPKR